MRADHGIGFQEIHPLTPLGRILTIAIGAIGIVTLGFIGRLGQRIARDMQDALHVGGLDLQIEEIRVEAARHNCDYLGVED